MCIITHPKEISSKESLPASNEYHQVEHIKIYMMKTLFFLFFSKRFCVSDVKYTAYTAIQLNS